MLPIKYSVFSAKTQPTWVIQTWYRLPSVVATFLLAAPFLLAVWVMVWSDLDIRTKRLQQEEADRVTRTSHLAAESLKSLFVSADLVLLELRLYWQNYPNEFHKLLKERHDKLQLGSTFDVFVIDASGKVLQSTTPALVVQENLRYNTLWSRHQQHVQDKLLMGPAFFDSITGRWQLPFTRRLLSASGKFEGIMVFLVPPNYFNSALQVTSLPSDSVFSIVDLDTGDLILRTTQVNETPTATRVESIKSIKSIKSIDFWSIVDMDIPEIASGTMVNLLPLPVVQLSANALARLQQMPARGRQSAKLDIDLVERLYAWNKLDKTSLLVTIGTPTSHLNNLLNVHWWRHIFTGTALSLFVLILIGSFTLYDRSCRRSRQALCKSEEALRQLAVHQTDLLEEERKFIAREVHDDLGQRLSVLRLDHAMLMNTMQSNSSPDQLARAAQVKDAIDVVLRLTRDLAQKVRPPSLEIGFLPAIEALCDEFHSRRQFKVNFVNNAEIEIKSDDACAITAYRILQEALTNAARYAQCQHVDINVAVQDEWLYLRVVDDGIGFDPSAPTGRRTFGLLGMRERVAALNGEMRIQSQPGQGCKLLVMLPLNSAAANIRPLAVSQ